MSNRMLSPSQVVLLDRVMWLVKNDPALKRKVREWGESITAEAVCHAIANGELTIEGEAGALRMVPSAKCRARVDAERLAALAAMPTAGVRPS